MKLIKPIIISVIFSSLCTTVFAIKITSVKKQPKEEPPFAVVAPGSRLVEGDLKKNEFYILGLGEKNPVKPKKEVKLATNKKLKFAEINKVLVVKKHSRDPRSADPESAEMATKVEINKVAVIKNKSVAKEVEQLANKDTSQTPVIENNAIAKQNNNTGG